MYNKNNCYKEGYCSCGKYYRKYCCECKEWIKCDKGCNPTCTDFDKNLGQKNLFAERSKIEYERLNFLEGVFCKNKFK